MPIYIINAGEETPYVQISDHRVFDQIREDDCVESIYRVNLIEETVRDVSEDIAREFFNKFQQDYDAKEYVPDFIIKQVEDDVDEYFTQSAIQTANEKRHNAGWTYGEAGRA